MDYTDRTGFFKVDNPSQNLRLFFENKVSFVVCRQTERQPFWEWVSERWQSAAFLSKRTDETVWGLDFYKFMTVKLIYLHDTFMASH